MKMQKIFLFVLLLTLSLFAATDELDTVRVQAASGTLQEIYTVQKGTKIKQGKFTSFYPDGKVGVESHYVNGNLDGVFKSYYANGKLWQEIHYAAGIEHGESKTYFENGNLRNLEVYKLGIPDGLSKEYNENGTLRAEFPYEKGHVNGTARMYDANGMLTEDLEIVNGIRECVYHKYNKGIVVHTAKFHRNRCIENCNF